MGAFFRRKRARNDKSPKVLALRQKLAAKKGSLGFGAENFLSPSNTFRNDIAGPLLAQQSTAVQHLASFKVYFSYRVGQLAADPRPRKGVQNDDLKVDENGGGNQGGGAPTATRPARARSGTPPGGPPPAAGTPGKAPAPPPGAGPPAARPAAPAPEPVAPAAPANEPAAAPVGQPPPGATSPGGRPPAGSPGGRP